MISPFASLGVESGCVLTVQNGVNVEKEPAEEILDDELLTERDVVAKAIVLVDEDQDCPEDCVVLSDDEFETMRCEGHCMAPAAVEGPVPCEDPKESGRDLLEEGLQESVQDLLEEGFQESGRDLLEEGPEESVRDLLEEGPNKETLQDLLAKLTLAQRKLEGKRLQLDFDMNSEKEMSSIDLACCAAAVC